MRPCWIVFSFTALVALKELGNFRGSIVQVLLIPAVPMKKKLFWWLLQYVPEMNQAVLTYHMLLVQHCSSYTATGYAKKGIKPKQMIKQPQTGQNGRNSYLKQTPPPRGHFPGHAHQEPFSGHLDGQGGEPGALTSRELPG